MSEITFPGWFVPKNRKRKRAHFYRTGPNPLCTESLCGESVVTADDLEPIALGVRLCTCCGHRAASVPWPSSLPPYDPRDGMYQTIEMPAATDVDIQLAYRVVAAVTESPGLRYDDLQQILNLGDDEFQRAVELAGAKQLIEPIAQRESGWIVLRRHDGGQERSEPYRKFVAGCIVQRWYPMDAAPMGLGKEVAR